MEELMKKRRKKISLESFDIDDFNGDIDDIIKMLERVKEEGYDRIVMEADSEMYDDSYVDIQAYGYRDETDEEVDQRVDAFNKAELQKFLKEQEKVEKEKQLLQELKQKYEA